MANKSPERQHVVLTGLSGSGKDYLLSHSREGGYLPPSVREVHIGRRIGAYLRYGVNEKDYIHAKSDLLDLAEALAAVLNNAVQTAALTGETLIFNAHLVHWHHEVGYSERPPFSPSYGGLGPSGGGFVNEGQLYLTLRPQPHAYLHVVTDPLQIVSWREQEPRRARRIETADEIAAHQELSLAETRSLAAVTGADFAELHNTPKNLAENLATIGRVVLGATAQA
jgi:hypothetical protein